MVSSIRLRRALRCFGEAPAAAGPEIISGPAASLAAPRSWVLSALAISGRSWNSRSLMMAELLPLPAKKFAIAASRARPGLVGRAWSKYTAT